MASTVFYRKWRPRSLGEVVGQEHITRTLLNALASGRVAHAYLFCGPRGTGKTSTARILAKGVNCLTNDGRGDPCNQCHMCEAINGGRALDLIEIDGASNRGINEVRDLREKVNFAPNEARFKVYIIDEVHMLTPEAFNALLKTLEEPPPHAIFVLATTEPHRIPATIMSRCQHFDFHRIAKKDMSERLAHICREEGISIDQEALGLVARSAGGSLRDAENLLEQLLISYGSPITLAHVQALLGITGDPRTLELAKAILKKDLAQGLLTINRVREDGLDIHQFHRELVDYLRWMLLLKTGTPEAVEVAPETLGEMEAFVERVPLQDIVRATKTFSQLNLRQEEVTTLPLELALLECALEKEHDVKSEATQVSPELSLTPKPSSFPEPKEAPTPIPKAVSAPKSVPKSVSPLTTLEETPSPPSPLSALEKGGSALPQGAQSDSGIIETLKAQWKDIFSDISNRNFQAMLRRECDPVRVEGNTVILGFHFINHRDLIDNPKNRILVEESISKALGTRYRVRCIHLPKEKKAAPQPSGGHLIRAAMELGAKIVEDQQGGKDEP